MARALSQILQELQPTYDPQRQIINQQINSLDPQLQAEQSGLDAQKTDSFNQITQGANRRGLFFSGIPLEEQARYIGAQYLPAVANLKSRFNDRRFGLQDSLANLDVQARQQAEGVYQGEVNSDLQREQLAQQAAAARAAAGAANSPVVLGGMNTGGFTQPKGATTTLRQQWQQEANNGDWNAQVALNYAGDDGRYDGPVNSVSEYNILKSMGIQGNYYPPVATPAGTTRLGGSATTGADLSRYNFGG